MSSSEEDIPSGTISTLSYATSKRDSLRTTVPKAIVRQFGLKTGDKLAWRFEIIDGKICVVVEPIKSTKKET